jgi:hypothetical protein
VCDSDTGVLYLCHQPLICTPTPATIFDVTNYVSVVFLFVQGRESAVDCQFCTKWTPRPPQFFENVSKDWGAVWRTTTAEQLPLRCLFCAQMSDHRTLVCVLSGVGLCAGTHLSNFCVVEQGGWLLEYYLRTCSSWGVHKLFQKYLKAPLSDKPQQFDVLLSQCLPHFVGWLVFHVSSVGTNGRRQQFYLTFVNKYFGLSRDGMQNNHKFGYGVGLTMFDDMKQQYEQASRRTTRLRMEHPHVQWWDNFSKFCAYSIPTLNKNTYASMLWTGVTVNAYTGPDVDIAVKLDDQGEVVPAMPADLFATQAQVSRKISDIHPQIVNYFTRFSLVRKYQVNSVPLKIDTQKYPALVRLVSTEKNNLKHIHPHKLIKKNIGSNRGLLSIAREFQEEHKLHLAGVCQTYKTLNLDENIYYRLLKVQYVFVVVDVLEVIEVCCGGGLVKCLFALSTMLLCLFLLILTEKKIWLILTEIVPHTTPAAWAPSPST